MLHFYKVADKLEAGVPLVELRAGQQLRLSSLALMLEDVEGAVAAPLGLASLSPSRVFGVPPGATLVLQDVTLVISPPNLNQLFQSLCASTSRWPYSPGVVLDYGEIHIRKLDATEHGWRAASGGGGGGSVHWRNVTFTGLELLGLESGLARLTLTRCTLVLPDEELAFLLREAVRTANGDGREGSSNATHGPLHGGPGSFAIELRLQQTVNGPDFGPASGRLELAMLTMVPHVLLLNCTLLSASAYAALPGAVELLPQSRVWPPGLIRGDGVDALEWGPYGMSVAGTLQDALVLACSGSSGSEAVALLQSYDDRSLSATLQPATEVGEEQATGSGAATAGCAVSGLPEGLGTGRTFVDLKGLSGMFALRRPVSLRNMVLYNLAPGGTNGTGTLPGGLEGPDAPWANSSLPLWLFGFYRSGLSVVVLRGPLAVSGAELNTDANIAFSTAAFFLGEEAAAPAASPVDTGGPAYQATSPDVSSPAPANATSPAVSARPPPSPRRPSPPPFPASAYSWPSLPPGTPPAAPYYSSGNNNTWLVPVAASLSAVAGALLLSAAAAATAGLLAARWTQARAKAMAAAEAAAAAAAAAAIAGGRSPTGRLASSSSRSRRSWLWRTPSRAASTSTACGLEADAFAHVAGAAAQLIRCPSPSRRLSSVCRDGAGSWMVRTPDRTSPTTGVSAQAVLSGALAQANQQAVSQALLRAARAACAPAAPPAPLQVPEPAQASLEEQSPGSRDAGGGGSTTCTATLSRQGSGVTATAATGSGYPDGSIFLRLVSTYFSEQRDFIARSGGDAVRAAGAAAAVPGGGVPGGNSRRRPNAPRGVAEAIRALRGEMRDVELEVTAVLGYGSHGIVYHGLWRGIPVAVKTLVVPEAAAGADGRSRQQAVLEAAISMSMSHPNVVATYTYEVQPLVQDPFDEEAQHARGIPSVHIELDGGGTLDMGPASGPANGRGSGDRGGRGSGRQGSPQADAYKLCIVQELCNGGSLKHAMAQGVAGAVRAGGSLRTLALRLALDVAQGMRHIHACRIVHGDLKPDNVLLASGGASRINSGASDIGDRPSPSRSSPNGPLASDVLMQLTAKVMASGEMSTRSDVWSFGLLLIELYYGVPLGDIRALQVMAGALSSGDPAPLHSYLLQDMMESPHRQYAELAAACLVVDPRERPTFADIAARLQELVSYSSREPTEDRRRPPSRLSRVVVGSTMAARNSYANTTNNNSNNI
ncbi:hypothetical protein GPECTOR_15g364 [Gonium pectorale]|uniref:Protein kinase domain-containing protein n=1 Tax=Gonium pectorale TaxID=33097 RepID=A0A150GMV9_GONPE|nr:hypothetical protein GPECTOR_15g364 [Gonium pectorale]|eukprot:KXZ50680.1 hypothetical protein GPECTOR_15g364 [Gonium pectorale]